VQKWDIRSDILYRLCRNRSNNSRGGNFENNFIYIRLVVRALLFCSINDFPTYENLSDYSVKGHYACPICEENTNYHQLKHGRKTCYIGHRMFLRRNHLYRRLKKAFNGCQEEKKFNRHP